MSKKKVNKFILEVTTIDFERYDKEHVYDKTSVLSEEEQLKNYVAQIFEIGFWIQGEKEIKVIPPNRLIKIIIK